MEQKKAYIITAVGAGGKSTYLLHLALSFVSRGKKTALTTTTHIYAPEGERDEEGVIRTASGIDYIGTDAPGGKLAAPDEKMWERMLRAYDVLLVEGDGSRCMPVKIPGEGEPVIPEETDEIAVIMGRHAIGRRLDVVCHRYDEKRLENGIVTENMLEEIAQEFYVDPIRERFPHAKVYYVPGTYEPEEEGQTEGRERLPVTAVLMASGYGRRYGGNKLLCDLDGEPLYRRSLDHIVQALGKEHVVVVTQYREILDDMKKAGIRAVHNPCAAEGISASIRIGTAAALEEEAEAVIFFAADMPYLPCGEIRRFVRQFLWSGKLFGCMESGPEHTMTNPGAFRLYDAPGGKEDGAPGRVRSHAADSLLSLAGDAGAMRIMKQHPQEIYHYQTAPQYVQDIDTPPVR